MEIKILSEHATHDNVAFVIDKDGDIMRIDLDLVTWASPLPERFDTDEYKREYGRLPSSIDVRDIGRYQCGGQYIAPDRAFRMTVLRRYINEFAEHLDNVSASLETMLAYVESNAAPPYKVTSEDHRNRTRVCTAAREYLRVTNPLTASRYAEIDEDEQDHSSSVLRAGVIGYTAKGAATCGNSQCNVAIKVGDLVLFDTATQSLYCCRECLDITTGAEDDQTSRRT